MAHAISSVRQPHSEVATETTYLNSLGPGAKPAKRIAPAAVSHVMPMMLSVACTVIRGLTFISAMAGGTIAGGLSPLTAAETTPPGPVTPLLSAPFEFSSGGATSWSLDPTTPSTADGGVSATYEGVVLQVDHLAVMQSPLIGTPGNFIETADLLSGEHGPAGGRVSIDTRQATLPTIGFKGLLIPSAIHVRRLPLDPARPKMVNFQVVLPDTGAFEGQLQTKDGWTPFRGWSERTEMILEGDILTGSLAHVRMVRIVLNGRPANGEVLRHNAEITRLKAGETLPSLLEELAESAIAGHLSAAQIVISLDVQGRPSASWTGGKVTGDLNFMNMRDLSAGSVPQPKAKPAP